MNRLRIPNVIGAVITAILAGFSALFFVAWIITSEPEESENAALESAGKNPAETQDAEQQSTRDELEKTLAELSTSKERAEKALAIESERRAQLEEAKAKQDQLIQLLQSEKASAEASQENATKSPEPDTLAAGDLDKLKKQNEELRAALGKGKKEIADRKKQLAEAQAKCAEEKKALQQQLRDLRRNLDGAVYGEQLKPAAEFPPLDLPFLVNNPLDLKAPVRPLFIRLREFQGKPDALEKLYSELKEQGIHSARHKVPFGVGSDQASDEETAKIKEMLKSASSKSRFLVVGYASADGSEKDNFELSSRRASNIAELIGSEIKNSEEAVQAVYFGQTDRFSAAEMAPNRIVEIWEVR